MQYLATTIPKILIVLTVTKLKQPDLNILRNLVKRLTIIVLRNYNSGISETMEI